MSANWRNADVTIAATDWRQPDRLEARPSESSLGKLGAGRLRRVGLLIHGWNVPLENQPGDFDTLRRKIEPYGADVNDAILAVSWRSRGAYWDILLDVPSFVEALADMLQSSRYRFKDADEVALIGHSMGCRLILELAARLLAAGFEPRLRLFLMAAAVPVSAMQTGKLAHAAHGADHAAVFFSTDDQALSAAFRTVQTLSNFDGGLFPEAVGLRGRPAHGVWSRSRRMLGYRHGDYWRSDIVASELAADHRRREVRDLALHEFDAHDMPGGTLPERGSV